MIEKKSGKQITLTVLKISGNVLFYLVILMLLLFSIMNINGGNRTQGFPNIFGKGMLSVQSSSMEGQQEDSFSKGDLLIVSVFKESDYDSLQVGQIVTFYDRNIEALNSHRIVYISRDTAGKIQSLAVQGDASAADSGVYDPSDESKAETNYYLVSSGNVANLTASDIKGVKTSIWRGAGAVLDNMQDNWLFYFVIPVLLFLIFEVFMVVKNVMALKGEKQKLQLEKDSESMKAELEAQKEALRAQILEELKAQQQSEKKEDEMGE